MSVTALLPFSGPAMSDPACAELSNAIVYTGAITSAMPNTPDTLPTPVFDTMQSLSAEELSFFTSSPITLSDTSENKSTALCPTSTINFNSLPVVPDTCREEASLHSSSTHFLASVEKLQRLAPQDNTSLGPNSRKSSNYGEQTHEGIVRIRGLMLSSTHKIVRALVKPYELVEFDLREEDSPPNMELLADGAQGMHQLHSTFSKPMAENDRGEAETGYWRDRSIAMFRCGGHRGEAFIQLARPHEIFEVVEHLRNQKIITSLGCRQLKVHPSSRQQRAQVLQEYQEYLRAQRTPVYRLRGLPFLIEEYDVWRFLASGLRDPGEDERVQRERLAYIRRINMCRDHELNTTGNGFVELYEHNEDVERRIMALNNRYMGQRYVEVLVSTELDRDQIMQAEQRRVSKRAHDEHRWTAIQRQQQPQQQVRNQNQALPILQSPVQSTQPFITSQLPFQWTAHVQPPTSCMQTTLSVMAPSHSQALSPEMDNQPCSYYCSKTLSSTLSEAVTAPSSSSLPSASFIITAHPSRTSLVSCNQPECSNYDGGVWGVVFQTPQRLTAINNLYSQTIAPWPLHTVQGAIDEIPFTQSHLPSGNGTPEALSAHSVLPLATGCASHILRDATSMQQRQLQHVPTSPSIAPASLQGVQQCVNMPIKHCNINISSPGPFIVRIGNLPVETNEAMLLSLLSDVQVVKGGIHWIHYPAPFSRESENLGGCITRTILSREAFIEVSSAENIERAVARHGWVIAGQPISVQRSSSAELQQFRLLQCAPQSNTPAPFYNIDKPSLLSPFSIFLGHP